LVARIPAQRLELTEESAEHETSLGTDLGITRGKEEGGRVGHVIKVRLVNKVAKTSPNETRTAGQLDQKKVKKTTRKGGASPYR